MCTCVSVQEKAKAVEENEELKKKLKTVSQKVEAVTSDLKRSEEEKKKIDERLQETETHRDLLLDKVSQPPTIFTNPSNF